ncbi:hypothetical protein IWQ60_005204, partial [Tieghemiomyces parasiticus]
YSLLNLLGLYHDYILGRAVARAAQANLSGVTLPDPPAINKYHQYFFRYGRSPDLYRYLSLLLTLLQFTENLCEMSVRKRWGDQARWRIVAAVEVAKAMCRMGLVYGSSGRMLFSPSYPERGAEPETVAQFLSVPEDSSAAGSNPSDPKASTRWRGKAGGSHYDSVAAIVGDGRGGGSVANYLMSKVKDPQAVLKPSELVPRMGSRRLWGEYLFILRPIIYVLAIRKWGRRTWTPWFLSLLVEAISRVLSTTPTPSAARSQLETTELTRRLWLFLYYLLRSPFYERYTKPRLDRFIARTEKKPLLSLFTGILKDYQPLWESVYFYTSAS